MSTNSNSSITYYMMSGKSRIIIAAFLLFLCSSSFSATITSTATGGPWATPGTWVGGVAPIATDDVVIATTGGNIVTIGAAATCVGVLINLNAILTATTFGLTVNGPWENDGTYNHGTTSTVTFGGGAAAINAGTGTANFRNISIASGATMVINTPVTTAGSFLYVIPAASTNSTVTVTGTNTLTVTGAMTIQRPTTTAFAATFNLGAGSLTVNGLFTMSALTAGRNSVLTLSTGTVNLNAGATVGTTGCLITFTDAGILNLSGTISTGPPAITESTGAVKYIGVAAQNIWAEQYYNLELSGNNTKSLNTGTTTVTNILTIASGTTLDLNSRIIAFPSSGAFLVNNGTLTIGTSTINYTGVAAQAILDLPYNNLGFSGAGAKTIAAGMTLSVAGNWAIGAPTVLTTTANANITGNTSGTSTLSLGSGTVTIGGNWAHSGTITPGTSSVHFNSASAQTLRGIFYNINLSGAGVKTLAAALTVNNILTINATSTLALSTLGLTLPATGTPLVNNGTFTANTGTVTFSGGSAQNVTELNYNNLTFSGAGTKTIAAGANIGIAGAWAIGSATIMTTTANVNITGSTSGTSALTIGSGTITIGGNWGHTGTITPGSSTVHLNSAAVQTVRGTFFNLTFSNGGINVKTLAASSVVNNVLTINTGATLALSTFTLTLPGTGTPLVVDGTLTPSTGTVTFSGTGAQEVAGLSYNNLTFSNGGTKTIPAAATVTVAGNWAVGSITVMTTTANATVTGAISGTSAITMGSGTITVGGAFSNSGTFTAGSGIVNYSGAAGQTVRGITYNDLEFSGAGTKTVATATTATVLNNWIVNSPVTLAGTGGANVTLDISGSGSITMGSGTIALEGAWTNNGTLTPGTGLIHYGGTTQNVAGQSYYRLQISVAGTKTLLGNTTVSNVLTISSPAAFDLGSNTLTLSGTGTPLVSTGTLIPSASTVFYTNAGAINITAVNYFNLDGTGGNRTLPAGGIVGIAGTFTPGGGTYTITNSTVHFNGSSEQTIPVFNYNNLTGTGGDRILDPAGTVGIAGTFTPGAGAYTVTTNTVNFNGSGAQTIPTFTFNDVILSNGGTKTITTAVTVKTITIQNGPTLNLNSDGGGLLNIL